jgi:hypothetical protein
MTHLTPIGLWVLVFAAIVLVWGCEQTRTIDRVVVARGEADVVQWVEVVSHDEAGGTIRYEIWHFPPRFWIQNQSGVATAYKEPPRKSVPTVDKARPINDGEDAVR